MVLGPPQNYRPGGHALHEKGVLVRLKLLSAVAFGSPLHSRLAMQDVMAGDDVATRDMILKESPKPFVVSGAPGDIAVANLPLQRMGEGHTMLVHVVEVQTGCRIDMDADSLEAALNSGRCRLLWSPCRTRITRTTL